MMEVKAWNFHGFGVKGTFPSLKYLGKIPLPKMPEKDQLRPFVQEF